MKIFTFLSALLFSTILLSQEVPRDTSYTFYSTLKKHQKKYPNVRIVYPQITDDILVEEEIIYRAINGHDLKLNVYYPAKKGKYRA